MAHRRTTLHVEALGARVLPGVALPHVPASAIHTVPPAVQASLHGRGSGHYTVQPPRPDAGAQDQFAGSVELAGLGHFAVQGGIRGVGFVLRGHAHGTLTLTGAHGALSLELDGAEQPGFAALPGQFHFHVTGGTGAYQHWSGQGTAVLKLTPDASHRGQGTFTFMLRPVTA
jgi:hypothetical protein